MRRSPSPSSSKHQEVREAPGCGKGPDRAGGPGLSPSPCNRCGPSDATKSGPGKRCAGQSTSPSRKGPRPSGGTSPDVAPMMPAFRSRHDHGTLLRHDLTTHRRSRPRQVQTLDTHERLLPSIPDQCVRAIVQLRRRPSCASTPSNTNSTAASICTHAPSTSASPTRLGARHLRLGRDGFHDGVRAKQDDFSEPPVV